MTIDTHHHHLTHHPYHSHHIIKGKSHLDKSTLITTTTITDNKEVESSSNSSHLPTPKKISLAEEFLVSSQYVPPTATIQLLTIWSKLSWERLTTDLRLTALGIICLRIIIMMTSMMMMSMMMMMILLCHHWNRLGLGQQQHSDHYITTITITIITIIYRWSSDASQEQCWWDSHEIQAITGKAICDI